MAIALNGKMTEADSGVGTVTTQTIVNTGLAINAGNAIIVCVRSGNGSAGQVSVADNVNAGNYTKAVEVADGVNNRTVSIWVKENSAAAAAGNLTVTVTLSATASCATNGLVYSGVLTSSSVDQVNSAAFTTSTATPTSGNITTTASGDLVIGAIGFSTGSTATINSGGGSESAGFTSEFDDSLGTASHQHLHSADDILSGTSTLAYAPTLSAATTGVIAVASFKAAGGAAPVVNPNLTPGADVGMPAGNAVAW